MGLPNEVNSALIGAAAAGGGYEIDYSLRWNLSSSQYLSRTLSSGPTTANSATISFWLRPLYIDNSGYKLFDCRTSGTDWYINIVPFNSGFAWGDMTWQGAENATGVTNYWTLNQYPAQVLHRDTSAWYHMVLQWDSSDGTSSARMKAWTNNHQSDFYNYYGSIGSNRSCPWTRNGYTFKIGDGSNSGFLMTEVHCVDGQVLDPDNFAEYSSQTGAWVPKQYTGSYGNNGFYLKMDPTATNGVGHDHSGNGNNLSATGFSSSTATYNKDNDSVQDTPTNLCCAWVPGKAQGGMPGQAMAYASQRSEANMYGNTGRNSPQALFGSLIFPDDAKSYVEVYINDVGGGGGSLAPAVALISNYNGYGPYIYGSGNYNYDTAAYYSGYNGAFTWNGGSGTSNGGGFGSGTLIGVAVDTTTSAPTITWYKNGTQVGTGTIGSAYRKEIVVTVSPSTGSSTQIGAYINSGQYDFNNLPTGYKGLCTKNFPALTVKNPSKNCGAILYTGNGASSRTISGFNFQPDFTVIKSMDTTDSWMVQDSVRGLSGTNGKQLNFNTTFFEGDNGNGHISAYTSDGFTLADGTSSGYPRSQTNDNGNDYIAWGWKASNSTSTDSNGTYTSTYSANTDAGFSIVTFNNTSSTGSYTVGHGLNQAPEFMMMKKRDSSTNWFCRHSSYHTGNGVFFMNNTTGDSGSTVFDGSNPTDTLIKLNGTSTDVRGSIVIYCFHSVPGYSRFGKYIGNASSDGPYVYLGFRPAILWVRPFNGYNTTAWDYKRSPHNLTEQTLLPSSGASQTTNQDIDALAHGFKIRSGDAQINNGGDTYVYMAWADVPHGQTGAINV